jgi:hypothetical protein
MTLLVRDKLKPRLPREVQAKIGRQLRAMYAELLRQELPEDLRDLMERLRTRPQPQ